jgi:hypothetical protein
MRKAFPKRFLIVFAVLVALVAAFDIAAYFTTSSATPSPAPVGISAKSLTGHWVESSGPNGVKFTADVTADSIQIWSQYGTSGGIFWMGSFKPADGVVGTISSLGDQDAMASQIFASNETVKVFNYTNDDLSFDYSIMGVHSTIHMSRS